MNNSTIQSEYKGLYKSETLRWLKARQKVEQKMYLTPLEIKHEKKLRKIVNEF